MKPTQTLHDLGQSLWLDNITRDLLNSGTLKRYIGDWSVTGLTSNPTIYDHAIKSSAYEDVYKRQTPPGIQWRLAVDTFTEPPFDLPVPGEEPPLKYPQTYLVRPCSSVILLAQWPGSTVKEKSQ